MTVYFDTRDYQFSHGKQPRGTGMWAFFFDGKTDNVDDAFFCHGTFAEAKKKAKAEAQRRGAQDVTVGS